MDIANSVTDLIGDTPLLRINMLTGPDDGMKYLSTDFYGNI